MKKLINLENILLIIIVLSVLLLIASSFALFAEGMIFSILAIFFSGIMLIIKETYN